MARFRNWGKAVFQTRLINGQKNVRCVQEPEAEAVKGQEIKRSKSEDEGKNQYIAEKFVVSVSQLDSRFVFIIKG